MIPTLETDRLRLRDWREDDFEPYAAVWADPEMASFMGGACSREGAWRRMAAVVGHWHLRGYGTWAVEDKSTRAFIGWCGLWYPEGWPEPELGYCLVRGTQGQGFATEAARCARSHAYEVLGWTTLISFIDLRNEPSIRVAQRLGARRESIRVMRGMEGAIYRHPGLDPVST